jgi:hypothetical protein
MSSSPAAAGSPRTSAAPTSPTAPGTSSQNAGRNVTCEPRAVRHGIADPGPQTLVAPLVTFLPGAALTTATVELAVAATTGTRTDGAWWPGASRTRTPTHAPSTAAIATSGSGGRCSRQSAAVIRP